MVDGRGDPAAFVINSWFNLCEIKETYCTTDEYVIAIDTPLGWPKDFVELVRGGAISERWTYPGVGNNISNSLLFRRTERELGSSLSAVTDAIGSQSTKGMTLLRVTHADKLSWGIWTANGNITVIETYPSPCLRSADFVNWMESLQLTDDLGDTLRDDTFDAFVCASVAKAYLEKPGLLYHPPSDDSQNESIEGWIFRPTGHLVDPRAIHGKKAVIESHRSFSEALLAMKKQVMSLLKEAAAVTSWEQSGSKQERPS